MKLQHGNAIPPWLVLLNHEPTGRLLASGYAFNLIGVYDFQRMNQVIIAYHAECRGEVRLSPELSEYRLLPPEQVRCWRAGTGLALAAWLKSRGIDPVFLDEAPRAEPT